MGDKIIISALERDKVLMEARDIKSNDNQIEIPILRPFFGAVSHQQLDEMLAGKVPPPETIMVPLKKRSKSATEYEWVLADSVAVLE